MPSIPTKITFHGLDRSLAVEGLVEQWISKITRVAGEVSRCEVVIESPHRHHRHGRRFHIRLELDRPGGIVVVDHDRGADGAHEDIYVAIRDAFVAARRQLARDSLAA